MRRLLFMFGLLACIGVACNKNSEPPPVTKTKETTTPVATVPAYDVDKFARDLKSTNPQNRDAAVRSIAELDEANTDVLPTLLAALKDPTCSNKPGDTSDKPTSSRETAVLAAQKLGSKGKKFLAEQGLNVLVDGLKDAKPTVREHTVNALGMMGTEAKSAVDAVAALCGDKDSYVRSAAYRALQKIKNPPGVAIAKLLTNPDVGIATDAAVALSWVKPNTAEAIPLLIEAIKLEPTKTFPTDDVTFVRNAAADALATSGKQAEAAIPALVELITKTPADQVEKMFRPAKIGEKRGFTSGPVSALRRIGKPALPAVLPLLKHEQAIVRYQAAIIIGGMGNDADTAKEPILTALQEERGLPTAQLLVFEELALAAIDVGIEPDKITERVLTILGDDSYEVRARGALILARLGRAAASAVGKLTEMLNELEPIAVRAAMVALTAIGPAAKPALPELIKKMEGENTSIARDAIKVVRALGPDAAAAVPSLVHALKANDSNHCVEAIEALGHIGPGAAEAIPALLKHMDDDNTRPEERTEILNTLMLMGPAAKAAIPLLIKQSTTKDAKPREQATLVLGKVGVGNADVLKRLTELLKDSTIAVRIAALKALVAHGTAAKSAAAEIKGLAAQGPGVELKMWASAALVALGIDADTHMKVLSDALKNKKPEGRAARGFAIEAMALLGAKAKPYVGDLTDALREKPILNERIPLRERAARCVAALGETAKETTPALVDLLREADLNLRKLVAQALGAIGPPALLAVPKLKELARNEPEAAEIAYGALDRIMPPKKMD